MNRILLVECATCGLPGDPVSRESQADEQVCQSCGGWMVLSGTEVDEPLSLDEAAAFYADGVVEGIFRRPNGRKSNRRRLPA